MAFDYALMVAIAKANGHPEPTEWADLVQAHSENPEGVPPAKEEPKAE